jgi:hypothetical protein
MRGQQEAIQGAVGVGYILCNQRLFSNWGVQRGIAPLPGVLGVSPNFHFPQDWGIEGVERRLLNNLQSLICISDAIQIKYLSEPILSMKSWGR